MAPIRQYDKWNERSTDNLSKQDPYRKYFFICEGENTETSYVKELINIRSNLGIHPQINVILLEKTEKDSGISDPLRLLQFANEQKANSELNFEAGLDHMVAVFDADVFEDRKDNFDTVLALAKENDDLLALTNPSFELFLLLHRENAFSLYVQPNEKKILENKRDGKRRFVEKLFAQVYGLNPKTNPKVGLLAKDVLIAISEEQHLNRDLTQCKGTLTSNVGEIINSIITDVPNL